MEQIHPDREQLAAFLDGALPDDERRQVEQHVARCDSCCDVMRTVPCEPLIGHPPDGDTHSWASDTKASRSDERATVAESDGVPASLESHARYRIVKKLGAGGMGVVYQAEHRMMQRPVALKVINRRLVSNPVAVERFRLEVRGAARLSHRNIVTAHDADEAGDLHFLVMEFIEGESLSEVVARRGELPVLHACNYISQAANGLQHAHEQGMVHRDIKPQNLMRTTKGTVKILDFGLARFASQQSAEAEEAAALTSDGVTLGTPDFISPEQARDSRRADIRADIYSLGCTMYYLLTGRVPFPEGSAIDKIMAHCNQQPPPLGELRGDLPVAVVGLVERMMAKDPANRFQTPGEVVEALKPFSRPARADQAPIDTRSIVGTVTPAERHTFVDRSPTLPSIEEADPLDLKHLELPTPTQPPHRRLVAARRPSVAAWCKRHQKAVIGVAAASIAVLLSAIFGPPLVRGLLGRAPEPVVTPQPPLPTPQEPGSKAGAWVDLLAASDTAAAGTVGGWSKMRGELVANDLAGARLPLPYQAPLEYDLEATFTRQTGQDSIALMFVMDGGQATFEVDGWGEGLAGIQEIRGQTFQHNQTRVGGVRLKNGRPYRMAIQVRCDRVTGFLDGKQIASYQGPGSDLSLLSGWEMPQGAIGVGAYSSRTVFHSIRVRPIHK